MALPENGEPVKKASRPSDDPPEVSSGGLTPEQKAARFSKLNTFLATKKLSLTSADGHVTVTVDGFGEILSISVASAALDNAYVAKLGRVIVETVNGARNRAEQLRSAGRAKLFPGMSEAGS